jgi:hypothetical protein
LSLGFAAASGSFGQQFADDHEIGGEHRGADPRPLGVFGYRLLAVAALPAVEFPTIQITATLPGASPETMGASVAGPLGWGHGGGSESL